MLDIAYAICYTLHMQLGNKSSQTGDEIVKKSKNTKNGGWVSVYEVEMSIDSTGDVTGGYYVVEFGKDGFPAHSRETYATKAEAMRRYRSAK